jgi:hypothetical protein
MMFLWLDVAVHDPRRVGVAQGLEQAHRERQRLGARERPLGDPPPERVTFDIFHRDERDPEVFTGLEKRRDPRMLEPAAGFGLRQQALPQLGVERGGEHLQRRGTPQSDVVRQVHLAHAARSQASLDPKMGDTCSLHGALIYASRQEGRWTSSSEPRASSAVTSSAACGRPVDPCGPACAAGSRIPRPKR